MNIWPEIFTDPDKPFHPELSEHDRLGAALATQLIGWANCMAGNRAPKKFGYGMLALRKITGVSHEDDISEAAAKWQAKGAKT